MPSGRLFKYNGERESKESVLSASLDDDYDDGDIDDSL